MCLPDSRAHTEPGPLRLCVMCPKLKALRRGVINQSLGRWDAHRAPHRARGVRASAAPCRYRGSRLALEQEEPRRDLGPLDPKHRPNVLVENSRGGRFGDTQCQQGTATSSARCKPRRKGSERRRAGATRTSMTSRGVPKRRSTSSRPKRRRPREPSRAQCAGRWWQPALCLSLPPVSVRWSSPPGSHKASWRWRLPSRRHRLHRSPSRRRRLRRCRGRPCRCLHRRRRRLRPSCA